MGQLNEEASKEWINQNNSKHQIKQLILNKLWDFCEKEFGADFENDYIKGKGSKTGLSDRTEVFVDHLIKSIYEKAN